MPLGEFRNFLTASNACRIHFVNDGSTDKTISILQDLKSGFPGKVTVLDLRENVGKAEAIRKGILQISKDPSVGYVGYLDADLSAPLEEMQRMTEIASKQPEVSMFMGSRVKLHGSTKIKRYWYRHYFGRVFATMVSKMLRLPLYDTQCGAKLILAEDAKYLFKTPFTSKWLFDIELIYRLLLLHGYEGFSQKLWELPLKTWIEKGDSKVSIGDLVKVPLQLIRIRLKYNRPLKRMEKKRKVKNG